ncbi:hypothetical protein PoB_001451200 [Plakobranchus ocellatus]|uniref:Uncharacterized protein n=1 Tax=Plakobranchus ocellatus TaxID=259542 RepID=A0AAV3YYE7_9GAST|nr:hypothetical protein PoB_001451200 [Plakobranchus ocellatus]
MDVMSSPLPSLTAELERLPVLTPVYGKTRFVFLGSSNQEVITRTLCGMIISHLLTRARHEARARCQTCLSTVTQPGKLNAYMKNVTRDEEAEGKVRPARQNRWLGFVEENPHRTCLRMPLAR